MSGGTQTCTTELQANSSGSGQGHHYKSYSLTGPSASQLSQSVRDRLMLGSQSLPKPGSPEFTALFSAHHRERGTGVGPASASFSPRVLKPSDGSLSDTCSNYAAPDLQGYYGTPNSPYTTSWMRHSNTYTPSGRSQGLTQSFYFILSLFRTSYLRINFEIRDNRFRDGLVRGGQCGIVGIASRELDTRSSPYASEGINGIASATQTEPKQLHQVRWISIQLRTYSFNFLLNYVYSHKKEYSLNLDCARRIVRVKQ